MKPSVSAIIVNYGTFQLTSQAVASILSEDIADRDVEIFVIDNTATVAEQQQLQALKAANVHLLFNKANVGFGQACNQAYELAQGEYILLLNPDAYLLPGSLPALIQCLHGHPKVGAVAPLTYWDDKKEFLMSPACRISPYERIQNILLRFFKPINFLHSHILRQKVKKVLLSSKPVQQTHLSGGYVLLQRQALDVCGGLFDPRFFMYYEDTDLFKRLIDNHYQLLIEPKAEAIHYRDQCPNPEDKQKHMLMMDSHVKYFQKYDPTGRINRLEKFLSKILNKSYPLKVEALGPCLTSPELEVPGKIKHSWMMELSPNANLFPCIVRFGSGDTVTIPEEAWKKLRAGDYYVRLGGVNNFFTYKTWLFEVLPISRVLTR